MTDRSLVSLPAYRIKKIIRLLNRIQKNMYDWEGEDYDQATEAISFLKKSLVDK